MKTMRPVHAVARPCRRSVRRCPRRASRAADRLAVSCMLFVRRNVARRFVLLGLRGKCMPRPLSRAGDCRCQRQKRAFVPSKCVFVPKSRPNRPFCRVAARRRPQPVRVVGSSRLRASSRSGIRTVPLSAVRSRSSSPQSGRSRVAVPSSVTRRLVSASDAVASRDFVGEACCSCRTQLRCAARHSRSADGGAADSGERRRGATRQHERASAARLRCAQLRLAARRRLKRLPAKLAGRERLPSEGGQNSGHRSEKVCIIIA